MWLYVRQLIQLILSPSRGWEDISEAGIKAPELQRSGFYPLIGVTGASEFLRYIYCHDLGFWSVVLSAIAIMAALFVSLYLSRLFLELAIPKVVPDGPAAPKIDVFATYLMGINCLYCILGNALPASMTFLVFLPLISLIIMFKAVPFMAVRADSQLSFLGLSCVAFIGIPLAAAALFSFLI